MNKQQYGGLDWARMAAALLVIAIHTSPLVTYSAGADWFCTRVLARTAVPLFFIISGFFLLPAYLFTDKPDEQAQKRIRKFFLKNGRLYFAAVLLYLPLGFYAGLYQHCSLPDWLRLLLLDGTFYHLWYFPAVLTAVMLLCFLRRWLTMGQLTGLALLLYSAGLLGDSYYGLAQQFGPLSVFYAICFQVCSYTRNGFFMAPIFLLMGAWMGRETEQKHRQSERLHLIDLLPAWLLFIAEACLLRSLDWPRHDSMYLCLLPVLYGLFQILLQWHISAPPVLRPLSADVYVLHPLVIVLVRGIAKLLGLTALLVENSVLHYWTVCLLSVLLSLFWIHLQTIWKQRKRLSHK